MSRPLARRAASGAGLIVVVAGAVWLGGIAVDLLLALAVGAAAWEFAGLLGRIGSPPPAWLLYPVTALLLFRSLLPPEVPALDIVLGAAVTAGLVGGVLLMGMSISRFAAAVTGALYLGMNGGYLLALFRWRLPDGGHFGARMIALTVGSAIAGDTVAYLAGTAFGRHRFFPRLSPRKSVEGAVAGGAAAIAWTAIAGPLLVGIAWYHAVVLGALLTVAAQGGDLVESALKREADVKDSSALIPGHGGVLDRLDSILFLGPVVYCYLRVIALR